MNGHYSVFDPTGNKIADCGTLRDAVTLVGMRGEGHYYQFKPYPGDIIDVSPNNQLPPNQKYIGWKDVTEKSLMLSLLKLVVKRFQHNNSLKIIKNHLFQIFMTKVDTKKYIEFVKGVTSDPSLDYAAFLSRTNSLEIESGCNVTQLLTAALGLTAESGEFTEVVKKMIFQGKPYSEENVFHMKRELGDICWYLAQACMALDTTFDEVIEMNVEKLMARYPGGNFDVHYSENRKEGDL